MIYLEMGTQFPVNLLWKSSMLYCETTLNALTGRYGVVGKHTVYTVPKERSSALPPSKLRNASLMLSMVWATAEKSDTIPYSWHQPTYGHSPKYTL